MVNVYLRLLKRQTKGEDFKRRNLVPYFCIVLITFWVVLFITLWVQLSLNRWNPVPFSYNDFSSLSGSSCPNELRNF